MNNDFFTFSEAGFSVVINKVKKEVHWSEVKSIIGFKIDKLTWDEICLDVFCENEFSFSISEETQGWTSFLENSKKAFPQIDKNWEGKIAFPAFKTNLTVIYDRENRSLEELEKEYYQEK